MAIFRRLLRDEPLDPAVKIPPQIQNGTRQLYTQARMDTVAVCPAHTGNEGIRGLTMSVIPRSCLETGYRRAGTVFDPLRQELSQKCRGTCSMIHVRAHV